MRIFRYAVISSTAAACAAAVVLGGAFFALPVLCPNGYSPDKCMVEDVPAVQGGESPEPVASVAGIDGDIETGLASSPASREGGDLTTRRVQVLPVSARGNGFPPVIGAMMVPAGESVNGLGVIDSNASTAAPAAEPRPRLEVVAATTATNEETPPMEDTEVAEEGEGLEIAGGAIDARTVSSDANVRSGPTRGAEVLYSLSRGEEVTVSEEQKGWLSIEDDQGRPGWIYSDYVE